MDPRSERFVTGLPGGVTLNTLHFGRSSGRKLVLLHGGGANAHWWDHLAPRLAERFHVIALDFRGHGDSDWPETLEPGAFQRDLEALLHELETPDVCLIGHSMGGHVALDHAARHPETRAVCVLELARGASRRERRRTRLALAARRSYRTLEEAIERFRFLPPAPQAGEELRRHIALHSVRREDDGRFGFKFDPRWFGLPPGSPIPLESVRCPALVVRGEHSALLTSEGLTELIEGLPEGRGLSVEGAGHNVHLERPTEILRALEAFLADFT